MDKSPDAFRTISEVAEVLDTPAHVLRFWESRFPQIRPVKRAGGRRYYRPSDVALLTGIKRLLHDEGMTIRGVQKILRDQGVRHVAGLSDEAMAVETADETEDRVITPAIWQPPEEVPEAGFIEVDEAEEEPAAAAPVQAVLPLFDAAPPLRTGDRATEPTPRPALPENASFASLIRALPPEAIVRSRPEVQALAARLAALRALMAERAQGGPL